METLTITQNYINKTSNMVLKSMLTCMENEIENRVESIASQIESKYGVSNIDKKCIEIALINDLCKSVLVYTEDDDQVVEFESSISIKGNFEMYGVILRNGEKYRFTTECIVAQGYVQRRHFRYLTKTNLPKSGTSEVITEVKNEMKRLNKIQRMMNFINGQKSYIAKFQNELNELEKRTEQDWIDAINNSEFPLLVGSKEKYNSFDKGLLETMEWSTFENYMAWVKESNENSIKREKDRMDDLKRFIKSCNNNIEKEQKENRQIKFINKTGGVKTAH